MSASESEAQTEALLTSTVSFLDFQNILRLACDPCDGLMISRVASLEKNDSWIVDRQSQPLLNSPHRDSTFI